MGEMQRGSVVADRQLTIAEEVAYDELACAAAKLREAQQQVERLEKRVAALEERVAELEKALPKPERKGSPYEPRCLPR